jgi:hypothetical protein
MVSRLYRGDRTRLAELTKLSLCLACMAFVILPMVTMGAAVPPK